MAKRVRAANNKRWVESAMFLANLSAYAVVCERDFACREKEYSIDFFFVNRLLTLFFKFLKNFFQILVEKWKRG